MVSDISLWSSVMEVFFVSSIHAAGYGARPRTKLRTVSAVVLKLIWQVSLKIFGAAFSSPSGCGIDATLPDSICSFQVLNHT